jgi:hypothetical protein
VLAVGADNDDGAANNRYESGAIFLFGFDDTAFGNGQLTNTVGYGYTSVGQVNVNLNNNDYLGRSVALNAVGDRMVAGLPGRDSSGGYTLTDTGAVYLFAATTLTPNSDLASLTFGNASTLTDCGQCH